MSRILAVTFSVVSILATPLMAQTLDERIKSCIDKTLPELDQSSLVKALSEMTITFSPFVEKYAAACFMQLTGQKAEFVKGTGLVFDSATLQVVKEAKEQYEKERLLAEEETAVQKAKSDRLKCEVMVATDELKRLELLQGEAEEARSSETFMSTFRACNENYLKVPGETLLNSVCQEVFQTAGLPDSEFSFDYAALLRAKNRVYVALYEEALSSGLILKVEPNKELENCKSVLGNGQ